MEVDRLELDTVRELVDVADKRVLEMGCGDGRFTYLYAHDAAYVLGVDPIRDEIRQARRSRPAELAKRVQFRVAKTITPPRRPWVVARSGEELGELRHEPFLDDLRATEGGMANTVRRGLFERIGERTRDIATHFDDPAEMLDEWL